MNMNIESIYRTANPRSHAEFEPTKKSMPGVAKGAYYVQPFPLTMARGEGCFLEDIDGHRYVDFAGHHTAQILGHGHPTVVEAVQKQLAAGIATAAPMGVEADLAEEICSRADSVDLVRFCNSGTEASIHAIRLARVSSGKPKVAKFEGGYHGSHDGVEISGVPVPGKSGPVETPQPVATAGGMAPRALDDVIVLPYNDEAAVESLIAKHKEELACVLLDPKCGLLPQRPQFIQAVREITHRHGILLILDEIVGFRTESGGIQAMYGIMPDITLFGKIIGGGFPIGAFGGRADVMSVLDPTQGGRLFQSGSFSGHPVGMVAGLAMLKSLTPDALRHLNSLTTRLHGGLTDVFYRRNIDAHVVSAGSVFSIYFQRESPVIPRDVLHHDTQKEHEFFLSLVNQGYYLGSGTRMCSLSLPMDQSHVDGLIDASERALS